MRILWVIYKQFDRVLHRTTQLNMMRELQARGHEVRLLTAYAASRSDYGLPDTIRYVPTARSPGLRALTFWLGLYPRLAWQIGRWRPDFVILDPHTALAGFPFDALSRLGLGSTRFVVDVRSIVPEREGPSFFLAAGRWMFRAAVWYAGWMLDGVTLVTAAMAEHLARSRRFDRQQVGLWSSGVDTADFDPEQVEPAALPPAFDGGLVALYHGSLTLNRGLFETVEAMRLLRETCPPVRLLLLGDGPAHRRIQELIAELDLEDRVCLRPAVPHEQVAGYLAACDIAVMAYPDTEFWRTSSPIKLMEYMAMGKPVILRDIRAFQEVVGDSGCALFIPDNSPATIAAALAEAWRRKAELPGLGARARTQVIEHYTWAAQARSLEQFLASLDGAPGPVKR